MAVKLIPVKCPGCGATLNIEENREQAFCTYCGAKVLIRNENEDIYRHIDDAQVKQVETERLTLLEQMEMAEKAQEQKRIAAAIKDSIILAIPGSLIILLSLFAAESSTDELRSFFVIFGLLGFFPFIRIPFVWMGLNDDKNDIKNIEERAWEDCDYYIRVPIFVDYEKMNYKDMEAIFTRRGFTNTMCTPLHDLQMEGEKLDMVETVYINGNKIGTGGQMYHKDAVISIYYHSLK